ncbi:MAG: Fe-S cluster assembly protein SufD, partial [Cyanobacteria bacterium J06641_5]
MSVGMASETDTTLASWLGTGPAPLETAALATLPARQQQAISQLQALQLPTRQDEEWRFTDISELAAIAWQPAPDVAKVDITSWELPETAGSRLVFVNGRHAPSLSDTSTLPSEGVIGNVAAL